MATPIWRLIQGADPAIFRVHNVLEGLPLPAAAELLSRQTNMTATPVAGRIDRNDNSPELVLVSDEGVRSGQSGIAFLGAFFGGHRHTFRCRLRFGRAQAIRVEVHGNVSRMNKIVAHIARDGVVVLLGEEVEDIIVQPLAGGFSIEMTFAAYGSLVDWIYLFALDADEGLGPVFGCAQTSLEPLSRDGSGPACRHTAVGEVEGVSVVCQSFSTLNNGFSLKFEILKPGNPLAGLGLSSGLGLAYARWWTWSADSLDPREGELVACRPTYPIRSPGLMDEYGADFANMGHAIAGVFAEWKELDRMGASEADRLAELTLHARFQDGLVVDLPLGSMFGRLETKVTDGVLFGKQVSEYAAANSGTPVFLEVGARGSASASVRQSVSSVWRYVGLDYQSDPNVDIVGDAHRLTDFIDLGSVDVVYSSEVMEHLLSPIRFVLEANRVLKQGGLFIARMPTTWPLHAEPWDFWRISSHGWTSILNANTGFKIIDRSEAGSASIVPHVAPQGSGLLSMAGAPAPMLTMVIAIKIHDIQHETSGWSAELASGSYNHA
ncbi:MAG: methyltransferase domain-containing protein [Paracoccaceae bacterium]